MVSFLLHHVQLHLLSPSVESNMSIPNEFFCMIKACNVKWLGLRGDDLQLIPEQSMVPLKQRDLQIATSLMSSEILQVNHPPPQNFGPFH